MLRESHLGQTPENTGKTHPNSAGGELRGNPVLAPRFRGETELEGEAPGQLYKDFCLWHWYIKLSLTAYSQLTLGTSTRLLGLV